MLIVIRSDLYENEEILREKASFTRISDENFNLAQEEKITV